MTRDEEINKASKKYNSYSRLYNIDGSHICYYDSIEDARRECGCARHISDVCLGKRKSCGGFVWKYAD